MTTRLVVLLLAGLGGPLLLSGNAHAQTCPVGKHCFYAPPTMPQPPGFTNGYDMVLAASSGTITGTYQLGTKTPAAFTATAGTPVTIVLSRTEDIASGYNVVEQRGAFVVADQPGLSVVQRENAGPWNQSSSIKDATFALGSRFRVGGYALDSASPGGNLQVGFDAVSLYAPFGATVTIAAPAGSPTTFFGDGITGTSHSVTLGIGETTIIRTPNDSQCGVDMTGALVTSDAPIAVISGGRGYSGCGVDGGCGDDGFDQLIPTSGLGTQYVVDRYNGTGERVTVIADTEGTEVRVNGTLAATLNAGEFHRFAPAGVTYIETSAGAYVFQDAGQDTCELGLSIIPPLALTGSSPLTLAFNVPGIGEAVVVIATDQVASLRYDDAVVTNPTVTVVPGRADLTVVAFAVTGGAHSVSAGGDFQLGLVTAQNSNGGTGLFAYYNTFRVPGCGDGTQSDTEACDDGNLAPGDGCNEACLIEVGTIGCDVDDDCEPAGRCEAGLCAQRCFDDSDCNDADLCTVDACNLATGTCENTEDFALEGCFTEMCPTIDEEPGAGRSRHTDVWTFGNTCMLTWDEAATAPTFTAGSSISTGEGCASFSDPETGQLLIYTDGIKVWNGAHTQVSTGLGGNPSSLHSGVIVPVAGEVDKVYVFGHGAGQSSGVNYQKFDLSAGEAVADGGISTIALPSLAGREGMVVAQHANGIDSWILVSGASQIFIISVSAENGVALVETVNSGLSVWTSGWSVFTMNHQNTKLAMTGNNGGNVVAWDFDPAAGTLSNRTVLGTEFSRTEYYGGVFSPDGTKLYFATLTESGNVSRFYQYDFNSESFILLSTLSPGYSHGDARLGPDGKIYIAGSRGTNALHVISDPNASGTAAGFAANALAAPNGCTVQLGLPQIPSPLSEINLALSVTPTAPTGTIMTSTTTIAGNANAPDGAIVRASVSGPDGYRAVCSATVANANWTCPADSIGPLVSGAYTVAAVVSFEGESACGEGAFDVLINTSISGCVWHDLDRDGFFFDESEPGLGGVTVTLTPAEGMPLSTTTETDGTYRFDDLPTGTTYTVAVDPMDMALGSFDPSPSDEGSDSRTAPATIDVAPSSPPITDVKFGYINGCAADTAAGTSCDDGSMCTTIDVCGEGGCQGAAVDCSDLDGQCAAGFCDPQDGMCRADVTTQNAQPCSDGDACTLSDVCAQGTCVAGTPVVCGAPDADACEAALTCNSETGQCDATPLPDSTPCEDGSLCTTNDTCGEGVCQPGPTLDCDDGNACTLERCDAAMGCVAEGFEENGSVCSDGSACTQADSCLEGVCVGADPVVCGAADQCQLAGVCAPETGLCAFANAPDSLRCDDGNACTSDEVCTAGSCGRGVATVCGEPGACELDGACNPDTGACEYPQAGGDDPLPVTRFDLGTLGGATSTVVPTLGDTDGEVQSIAAGHSDTSDGRVHVFVVGEGLTDITPEATLARAIATAVGVVLFVHTDTEGTSMVATWDAGATTDLWPVIDIDTAVATNVIDAGGVIAGTSTDGAIYRDALGVNTAITPVSGGTNVRVHDLAAGQVIGRVTVDDVDQVFIWTVTDGMTVLGAGAPVDASLAGVVWNDSDPSLGAHFRGTDGVVTDLGADTVARALSDDGVVVGQRAVTNGKQAFVWDAGTVTDLGTLGGPNSDATLVDATGHVAGVADTGLGVAHAFLWQGSGEIIDLGALGGPSTPLALLGDTVVGSAISANGTPRAFVWTPARGFDDLGTFVAGQPVAVGIIADTEGGPRIYASAGHAFFTEPFETGCVACDPGTDTEAPQITCPVSVATTECMGDSNAIDLPAPSVRDACGLPVVVTSDAPPVFGPGGTQVTYTATDSEGNAASCSVSVRVVDTRPPQIACPAAITVSSDDDVCGTVIDLAATATDACDAPLDIAIVDNAPPVFPIGTTDVRITATDKGGNRTTCDTTVTVVDTSKIQLVCPNALTIDAAPNLCGYDEGLSGQRVALCDTDVEIQVDDTYPIGTTDVVFRTTDRDGEPLTCTTELTVQDVTPPRVRCDAPTEVTWEQLPIAAKPSASDACGATLEVEALGCRQSDVDADVSEVCAATLDDDGQLTLGRGDKAGYVVRWDVTAKDPSGNETTATCEMTVAAALPEPGIDITGLSAQGGGGCQSGSSSAPTWLLLMLAGLALFWRRQTRLRMR